MRESTYQKRIIKRLKSLGNCYHFVKEAKTIRGIPDIVGSLNGNFFALEVKKSVKEVQETTGRIVLQKYNIQKIKESGGYASFIYPENEEEIFAELMELGYYFSTGNRRLQ